LASESLRRSTVRLWILICLFKKENKIIKIYNKF
jgi:hypothetical protein